MADLTPSPVSSNGDKPTNSADNASNKGANKVSAVSGGQNPSGGTAPQKPGCDAGLSCVIVPGSRPREEPTPGSSRFNSGMFGVDLGGRFTGNTSKDHFYSWSVFRCLGNCVAKTFRELKYNPAPSVNLSKPVQTGDVNMVGLAGIDLGPIMTAVNSDNNTIWNLTLPGHMLYPGWVERTVFFDGKSTWVNSSGGGTGFNPFNLNTVLAPLVWGGGTPSRLPEAKNEKK